jgi:hypothetical protein
MRCPAFSPRYLLLSLIVAALIVSGCAKGDGKDAKTKDGGKDKSGPPVTVVVADVIKEYKADAGAADKKYKDKVIEFEGIVFVPPDPATSMLLVKDPGATEPAPTTMRCMVAPAHVDKARALKIDQKVKVKGQCGGSIGMFVDVINAELVEAGPAPKQ